MAETISVHDEARERFLKFLEASAVEGTRGSETAMFIPFDKLKEYLQDHIHELLETSSSRYEPTTHHAANILASYSRVFAILLSINKGAYIYHFDQYDELTDRRLPFHNNTAFPLQDDFFTEFQHAQPKFCTRALTRFYRQYNADCILPFSFVGESIRGNSGIIRRIEIHSGYDLLCPGSNAPQVCPLCRIFRSTLIPVRAAARIHSGY